MYIIRSLFFGKGIMNITMNQLKELIKIYKTLLTKKIHLGKKFPRKVLYFRRMAIGIGLLKPKTIIAILAIR